MKRIISRGQLIELAEELGVQQGWHKPDEQGITARVEGVTFDNAGFWPATDDGFIAPEMVEHHVILTRDGEDVAAVNLATLFAWTTDIY